MVLGSGRGWEPRGHWGAGRVSGRLIAGGIASGTAGLKKHVYILSLKNKQLTRTRMALVTQLRQSPPLPASGGPVVPRLLPLGQHGSPSPRGAVGGLAWCLSPGAGWAGQGRAGLGSCLPGPGGRRHAPRPGEVSWQASEAGARLAERGLGSPRVACPLLREGQPRAHSHPHRNGKADSHPGYSAVRGLCPQGRRLFRRDPLLAPGHSPYVGFLEIVSLGGGGRSL